MRRHNWRFYWNAGQRTLQLHNQQFLRHYLIAVQKVEPIHHFLCIFHCLVHGIVNILIGYKTYPYPSLFCMLFLQLHLKDRVT